MKKILILMALAMVMGALTGCSELAGQIDTGAILEQVETVAKQIDVEALVTEIIESIDWEELKTYAQQGYDALTDRYPALKAENVKSYLKDSGLSLLNRLVESTDQSTQENARKLGEILKILNPELAEEVDYVTNQ